MQETLNARDEGKLAALDGAVRLGPLAVKATGVIGGRVLGIEPSRLLQAQT